ncbi:MAG: MTAP family purine nucleoside phosphorylase [Ardenticatenaceae bacterium]|nr:MTAP family purine nucleoside phosphorylase [Ardenticatenaceae bacterium]
MMQDTGVVILGGTAAYNIDPADFAEVVERRVVETPYGRSPVFLRLLLPPSGGIEGGYVWFSSRHGEESLARSARFVNHRANLWAVRALGATATAAGSVQAILSWNGVGAINPDLRVGDMVVPEGIMDWTRHRVATFGADAPHFAEAERLRQAARTIGHIENGREAREVGRPFAAVWRERILGQVAGEQSPISNLQSPVYVCTEGPRLETAAEIALAAELGADVVGMTLCPEVWLAAELGLAYASLCLVTNFATGRWHIDPRRDFGASVAERAMEVLLRVAGSVERRGEREEGGAW